MNQVWKIIIVLSGGLSGLYTTSIVYRHDLFYKSKKVIITSSLQAVFKFSLSRDPWGTPHFIYFCIFIHSAVINHGIGLRTIVIVPCENTQTGDQEFNRHIPEPVVKEIKSKHMIDDIKKRQV